MPAAPVGHDFDIYADPSCNYGTPPTQINWKTSRTASPHTSSTDKHICSASATAPTESSLTERSPAS
jgi:hypothetical protein